MKRIIYLFIIIIVFLSTIFLAKKTIDKIQKKKYYYERIKEMPSFEFYSDNKLFTNKNLKDEYSTVFVFFDSECEYCVSQLNSIIDNIAYFNNCQILLISLDPLEYSNNISIKNKSILHEYNVFILEDRKMLLSEVFYIDLIPTTLIYNKNRKLLKKFNGQTLAEKIIKELK